MFQKGYFRWLLVEILLLAGSIAMAVGLANVYLIFTGYIYRPYNWIFSNEEFIWVGNYKNFFTLDKNEIFLPRKNTSIIPGYWETDEYGFRLNPNHQANTAAGSILVLGDSFAYGHGVSHMEAWPAVLENELKNIGTMPLAVHNAGVPASGTDQQFIRFQRLMPTLKPHTVIWMITFNDMVDSNWACLVKKTRNNSYRIVPGFFNLAYINGFFIKYLPKWFVMSPVGNILVTQTVGGRDLFTFGCSVEGNNRDIMSVYFDKLEYILKQARLLAQEKNIFLLFVLVPSQRYLDGSYPNDGYEITFLDNFRRVFQNTDIRYVDLGKEITLRLSPEIAALRTNTKELASIQKSDILGVTTDNVQGHQKLQYELYRDESPDNPYGGWHFNAQGNAVIANIVLETLLSYGFSQK